MKHINNILSIAGLDPSGGAGVIADIKTISSLGGYGCAIITSLTSQNTQTVNNVNIIDTCFLNNQIDTLFNDVIIDSIKIGMLGNKEIVSLVANKLKKICPKYIVLDPVMIAKGGNVLTDNNTIKQIIVDLLPIVTCLTPNIPEAEILLERKINTVEQMKQAAKMLKEFLPNNIHNKKWVMLKGGHLIGDMAIDIIYDGNQLLELSTQKIFTKNTHGTGCTLSAAIATLLPIYHNPFLVAKIAKNYLFNSIKFANKLNVGKGHGPVHHFQQWW
ncbi:Hydroxymethylpyrimidine/phosphomethylpyrimidine kinase [Candidatus Kinetoplastibacterium sorsogonicusi]|uniref:hydroxymethylpyrimidine kinase n=1 Tax=Candidatus Kinetoplastidibacterium kentomonadis TaxID=1576550 RepID=A0A3Q8ER04_9PROT|nr:bifunctional hydroxymethylpyrimidine kinase/phosphomethylpyrimidine kinase [Candidatus Kinetoplastibacterium sorsogonicusi]AWD32207.1 Hydroxymethylpyrimidine/phosphomethylpyrimidine kinase [Candidatus Kinetoplastibacterium sorsogonicusi]